MSGSPVQNLVLAALAGSVIVIDQLSKLHIMETMRLHESIPIIPEIGRAHV